MSATPHRLPLLVSWGHEIPAGVYAFRWKQWIEDHQMKKKDHVLGTSDIKEEKGAPDCGR